MEGGAAPYGAAPAVVVALLLAACGQNLPADEFTARANAVCRDAERQLAALQVPDQGSPAGFAELGERAQRVAEDAEERLRKIVPPRETTSAYGDFLIHLGDLIEELDELAETAAAEEGRRVTETLEKLQPTAAKGERSAREAGLDACARALDLQRGTS